MPTRYSQTVLWLGLSRENTPAQKQTRRISCHYNGFLYFYCLIVIMENKPIARTLRLLSQLMELHEVNPFKIKSVANAAFKVDKLPFPIAGKKLDELEKIDGIGKSIAGKVAELLETGTMIELQDMLDKTPAGVVEMMGIKDIGPKKVAVI